MEAKQTITKSYEDYDNVLFDKTQALIGIIIIIGLIIFGTYLNSLKVSLPMHLFAGVSMGYILSRGRFGFAGGVKRLVVRGEGTLTKALLAMVLVTLIVTFGLQWLAAQNGAVPSFSALEGQTVIPGTQNVVFANIGTILGGILFGVGMMFSGGCASGTLTDMGEGEGRAWLTIVFFVIGSLPGEWARAVLDKQRIGKIGVQAYLPDTFGYFGALAISILGLAIIYYLTLKYEKRRRDKGTSAEPFGDWESFEKAIPAENTTISMKEKLYHKLFIERWTFMRTGLLLAFVWIFILVSQEKAWGVTSAFSHLGAYVANIIGIEFTNPKLVEIAEGAASNGLLMDGGTIRNFGLIIGAVIAFLLAGRFKWNASFTGKDSLYFIIGGLLMGFGARLAKGCNAGALYSAISTFSISGWVFLVSMTIGGLIGLKFFAGKACTLPKLK
ncbi:YeeE/YedE family protein [Enterococcus sp.]|uniref:YeeE/YedE family protein n=1 Tax=Enterococcus sp. TaxID=35783 RepID=UPI002FC6332A